MEVMCGCMGVSACRCICAMNVCVGEMDMYMGEHACEMNACVKRACLRLGCACTNKREVSVTQMHVELKKMSALWLY